MKEWGFNSVRLPFSNQMLHDPNPVPDFAVAANPELRGKTFLEVYDFVVESLADVARNFPAAISQLEKTGRQRLA